MARSCEPAAAGLIAHIKRREFLVAAGATVAAGLALKSVCARAAPDLPVFKVGTLPSGTVQWEIKTITGAGLDKAAGLHVEEVPLASDEAGRVAFLSGSVDAIVSDLLFAARLRGEGQPIQFFPFSTNEGALLVPANSPIRTIADLAGKSIGVAGGPLDKSWILLRAAAEKQKIDLASVARPVFGASPLLMAKLERGEVDAGLLYWNYAARLRAKGYREVVGVEQLANTLGASSKIAFTGFLMKTSSSEQVRTSFGKAVREAEQRLAVEPNAWGEVRPFMKADDQATFLALKKAFIGGIPQKSLAAEKTNAAEFYALLTKLGGSAFSGLPSTLPSDLYVSAAVYG